MLPIIVAGIRYKAQPIYRGWNKAKNCLTFFSREVARCPDKTWKVQRYILLQTTKIDKRRKPLIAQVHKAENLLLRFLKK